MMSFNSGTSEDNSLFWERHKASSIIISAALFLLLTFFCMWKFCSYGGPRASSSRNQPSMGDFNEPDPDPDDHHHSIQIQGLGLELWVVSSLPTSQFKNNGGSNKECAICLAEFEEEEWVKRLPSCAHVFHVSCIATWFRSRSNCPICRANVNHQDHLALSLESSVSNYASPDETLSREELSRERPSQLGSHTTTLQPTSCTN